jgi:glutamate-5-semialdehyde dehydrogenase
MELKKKIEEIAKQAKEAWPELANTSSEVKNKVLLSMADVLEKNISYLERENKKDLIKAEKKGLSKALIDRLRLTPKRIKEMSACLKEIAELPDPVGEIMKIWRRPNGLKIGKMRVPIGVIAIIYESRPNVTSDCVGLCVKSGNAIILRGGSEAYNSNQAIYNLLISGLNNLIPKQAIQFIPTTERKAVDYLLKLDKYIDLLIPRGGESLIKYVTRKARMPVIKHYKGVCHVYVDKDADLEMAMRICFNAKVQRPSVCNAMETLLVDEKIAEKFLPLMLEKFREAGVEIRGCKKTKKIIPWVKNAKQSDWYAEYLDLILAVKVVSGVDAAIEHIRKYGSNHSDAIVTENYDTAWKFLEQVDSSAVYVNASTRFTDGYQFGLGAEMGISTDKIHARGPMALEELTTYKYIVFGNGQIRE